MDGRRQCNYSERTYLVGEILNESLHKERTEEQERDRKLICNAREAIKNGP